MFHTVYENLINLKETGIPLRIAITPNIFMYDDFKDLLRCVGELKIPYVINPGLVMPRNTTGRKLYDLTPDQYVELFSFDREISNTPIYDPIDFEELPEENNRLDSIYGLTCGAGKSAFDITYDGYMCPCLSLSEYRTNPLKDGFQMAWSQLNDISDGFLQPQECIQCVYYKVCTHCVAIHKSGASYGHRNPLICERTKKMIQAGCKQMPVL